MTTLNFKNTIKLTDFISQNLAFRDTADDLFIYINNLEANSIIMDFSNIQSITASFAHQYMIDKEQSRKIINEINVPDDIKKMFELIERRKMRINKIPIKL